MRSYANFSKKPSRARDIIFILMLASVVYFLASFSTSTPPTGEEGVVFPTGEQLENFSMRHHLAVRFLALFLNAAFIFGICLCIYFLLVLRKRDLSFGELPDVCWNVWDISRGGILFLYIGVVLAILNPLSGARDIGLITYNLIAEGAAIFYLIGLVGGDTGRALASIGLRAKRFFRQAAVGLLAYVAFVPVFIGLVLVTTLLGRWGGVELAPQRHFSLFIKPLSPSGYIFLFVCMGFIAPVLEEIFFRGFVYRVFKRRFGILCAVLSSALLFSLLHFNIATLLPIFGLGVLLAYIYERTGSLAAPIIIHILQNSIALSAFLVLLWIKNTF